MDGWIVDSSWNYSSVDEDVLLSSLVKKTGEQKTFTEATDLYFSLTAKKFTNELG